MTRREAIQRAAAISGFTLTAPAMALLEGCQPSADPGWEPQVLTRKQLDLVGKVANRILPPTETLGALDVGVDRFIDIMLSAMFPEEHRQAFVQQIDDFSLQEATFVDDTEEIQQEKLMLLEQTYAKAREADPNTPKPFFRTIKELTLLGYFTSEPVMKNQLNYYAVPGRYDGCTALADNPSLYVDNNV